MAQIAAGAPGAAELQRRYGAAIMHVLGQSQPQQPPPASAPPQPADPAAEDARRQQLESDAVGVTSSGYGKAIRMIEAGDTPIGEMHTHRFALPEAGLAIRTLARQVPGEESIHSCLIPEH